jgi:methanogenic corrinoid protein MtbC1
LIAGLECLGEILSDELPETTGMGAVKLIRGALDLLQATRPEVPPILDVKKEHGTLTARYMTALLEGNRGLATQLVLDPVRSGALTVRDALLHVCEPAQREIGRMWHLNEISISDEHAVSATTIRVISQIMTFAPSVEPTGKTVLAASIGDDSHDIGLRLVSELFELDGWKVIFLGSRLPPDDFAWAAKEFVPDLALLSAATDAHRSNVNKAITLAREVHPELAVLIGGPGFESKEAPWTSSGASACGVRTADAVQVGRELVGLPANP